MGDQHLKKEIAQKLILTLTLTYHDMSIISSIQ
jgi:hypothetical protein